MANVSFQAFLFNRDSITGIGWQREGIDREGLNFYLPQLIPSFLPSFPFRPPFSSHFRRTRPPNWFDFCVAVATIMSHSATQLTIYPSPSFFVPDGWTCYCYYYYWEARNHEGKMRTIDEISWETRRWNIIARFFLPSSSLLSRNIFWWEEKCVYTIFWQGRNLWYRSRVRKYRDIVVVSLYNLFYLYIYIYRNVK